MADNAEKSAASRAAKKNKKRNCKKSGGKSESSGKQGLDLNSMLTELKKQLEEAKLNKDHKRSATLRDQIWVLTDLVAGVKTAIPEDELDKIIESIHAQFHPNPEVLLPSSGAQDRLESPAATSPAATASSSATSVVTAGDVLGDDRKLRNLRKKLDQIQSLKGRQQRGEKLEANQIEKLKGEEKLKEEIAELEEILKSIALRH